MMKNAKPRKGKGSSAAQGAKKRVLTADDLFAPGSLSELPVPPLAQNGEVPVVYVRALSAAKVLEFSELLGDAVGGKVKITPEKIELVAGTIADAICNAEGERLFSPEDAARLATVRYDVFFLLMNAVAAGMTDPEPDGEQPGAGEGNVSGEAPGGASPTA